MLKKRTNLLFDEETWEKLYNLSKKENKSVGELVRLAINKVYFSSNRDERIQDAYEHILKTRKSSKGEIDYKELVEHGRKQ